MPARRAHTHAKAPCPCSTQTRPSCRRSEGARNRVRPAVPRRDKPLTHAHYLSLADASTDTSAVRSAKRRGDASFRSNTLWAVALRSLPRPFPPEVSPPNPSAHGHASPPPMLPNGEPVDSYTASLVRVHHEPVLGYKSPSAPALPSHSHHFSSSTPSPLPPRTPSEHAKALP
jgi:hypothetical protein